MGATRAIILDTGKFDVPQAELEAIVQNPDVELFTTSEVLGEIKRWKNSPNYSHIFNRENTLRQAIRKEEDFVGSEDFQDIMTYQGIIALESSEFKANPNLGRMLVESLPAGLELDLSHLTKKDAKAVRSYLNSESLREVYEAHNITVNTEGAGVLINPQDSGTKTTVSLKKGFKKGKGNAAERLIAGSFSDPKSKRAEIVTQLKEHHAANAEFYNDFEMAQNVVAYFKRNGLNVLGYTEKTKEISQVAGLSSKSLMSDVAKQFKIGRLRGYQVPTFIAGCDRAYLQRVREMGLFSQEDYDHSRHGDVIEKLERAAIRCISKGGYIPTNNEKTDVNLVANALYSKDLAGFKQVELRTLDNDISQMVYFGKLQADANRALVNNVKCKLYRPREYMMK